MSFASSFFLFFSFSFYSKQRKKRNKRNTVLICGTFCLLQVHLKSQFILNGVCVIWRGWIDLVRLDGIGSLDFDGERAEVSSKTVLPTPTHPGFLPTHPTSERCLHLWQVGTFGFSFMKCSFYFPARGFLIQQKQTKKQNQQKKTKAQPVWGKLVFAAKISNNLIWPSFWSFRNN